MTSIYGFRGGPTYRPATAQDMWDQALDLPMSQGATFWDQAKGGALESFGLGTAIRSFSLPPAASTRRGRETDQEYEARQERLKAISEEDYKASPYYREGVPWDAGMTEDRAAALATMYDTKKVREYFAEKRPITSFFGNLAGQAVDPINYIPVAGPSVKAAAVARMGIVKGVAATAALDAAANTAIAGLATREIRRGFGDDVSWEMMVSEIATAALLGTAFGTVGGVLERRAGLRADALRSQAEVKVQTLKATQEARIALNEAIGGLANDGEVRLSPNAVAPITRIAAEMEPSRFQDWAAGSKLVDENGQPLVLYHQTAKENVGSIESQGFDINRIGARGTDEGMPDGVFLKTTPDNISVGDAENAAQMEVYASLKNPLFVADREALDAILLKDKAYAELRREASDLDTRLAKEYDEAYKRLDKIAKAEGRRAVGKNAELDAFFERWDSELRTAGAKARARATQLLKESGFDGLIMERDEGSFGRSVKTIVAFDPNQTLMRDRTVRAVDASPARPEAPPMGRAEAEAKVAKPENYKALADQYRVDPEAGTFPEEAELRQLAQEGRLSEEDMAVLNDADEAWQDSLAYSEALRSVTGCLI